MNVSDLIILPLLIPFFTAVITAMLNGRYRIEKAVSLTGGVALCAWVFWMTFHVDALPTGVLATVMGGWDAPFGVAMVADRLACIMLCLSSGVGLVAMVYSFSASNA